MSVNSFCPIEDTAVNFFNRKWVSCIIFDMFKGKTRFNEFKESNPTLSNHVLSQTLKFMEEALLIEKISNDNRTEYLLTEKGLKSNKILYEMALYSLNELNGAKLNENTKKKFLEEYRKILKIEV